MNLNLPQWLNALNLRERLQALSGSSVEIDRELALDRLADYRAQTPFTKEHCFHMLLAHEEIEEAEFLQALGVTPESLASRAKELPGWLLHVQRVYQEYAADADTVARFKAVIAELYAHENQRTGADAGHSRAERSQAEQRAMQLLVIADPFIQDGFKQLCAGAAGIQQGHKYTPFDSGNLALLFLPGLRARLGTLLIRTLVLEMNVARVRGQLVGETPEARFNFFLRLIAAPANAIAIFEEYPVLARLLVTITSQWVENSLELLQRLSHDWQMLRRHFAIPAEARLTHLQTGAGDTHRQGRSVSILRFDSGQKLVYKPHSLATNVHFAHLLGWLKTRGLQTQLHELKAIDRGDYGWTEFLDTKACDNIAGVQRYYRRLGALTSLAYALHATDLHWENVLACGEHPVLVDLETLLHPNLPQFELHPATRTLIEAKDQSVLRTSLLPERIWMRGESEGIDISGFGGSSEQLTPVAVTVTENEGSDDMRFVARRIKIIAGQNQPTLHGEKIPVADFAVDVLNGFEEMYRLLWLLRGDLLEAGGPLSWFHDDETRVIVRPTQTYGQILSNGFHPNAMRHGLDFERMLDRLWAGVERRPELERVLDAEKADLQAGDIPVFFSRPCSRSLWTSAGTELPDFLAESALTTVHRNLRRFSENDLARQVWFIRSSLASMQQVSHPAMHRHAPPAANAAASTDQILSAAHAIARKIEQTAYCANGRAIWIGLSPSSRDYWTIGNGGFDLYSGTAGIAMFLGFAATFFREANLRELASLAIHTAIDQAEESRQISPKSTFTTGMAGIGGLVYVAAHLGHLWSDASLLKRAANLVTPFSNSLDADRTFDIIGGAAGYLCGLLALYEAYPSFSLTRTEAIRAAEHLLQNARTMPRGIAWNTTPDAFAPLTGFSHGASGIAYALLRLFFVTHDVRYRDAAFQAFQFESTQFSAEELNWYDFRSLPGNDANALKTAVAWCHGAPGIGLARLYALGFTSDPAIRADLDAALATTWRNGFPTGHCLCHGDLGNLELLLEADRFLPEAGWQQRARKIAGAVLHSAYRNGWTCGTPSNIETPEFMVGLSGIGYGLLRVAEPLLVPSVLMLEAPQVTIPQRVSENNNTFSEVMA